MTTGRIVYIAGPMTGLPDFNYPAFHAAEKKLWEQGLLVRNPANTPEPPADVPTSDVWAWYMRRALPMLLDSDQVAVLPGWSASKGARLEVRVAQDLGMPVWDFESGVLLGAPAAVDQETIAGAIHNSEMLHRRGDDCPPACGVFDRRAHVVLALLNGSQS